MLTKLQLSESDHIALKKYADHAGIEFLSSPFDVASVTFLATLGMRIFKVPSGEITNLPLLRRIGEQHKKVILSSGMSTMIEISEAIDVLCSAGLEKAKISVLHCVTEYPAPYEEIDLLSMCEIQRELDVCVGYSDHTVGFEIPIGAVALGARIIEKHFTLDTQMSGPDHLVSADPIEFAHMVNAIRHIEKAIGKGEKKVQPSEYKNMIHVRKSIVAKCPIHKGDLFSEMNVTVKRPATGISPMQWDSVIGKKALRDFNADEDICL
jgi:N,N'-diacetyllegionaminate synthase